MNKLSKYIATATLATAFTISAPLNTYASDSHAKQDENYQTTQQQQKNLILVRKILWPCLGIKIQRSESTIFTRL